MKNQAVTAEPESETLLSYESEVSDHERDSNGPKGESESVDYSTLASLFMEGSGDQSDQEQSVSSWVSDGNIFQYGPSELKELQPSDSTLGSVRDSRGRGEVLLEERVGFYSRG